MELFYSSSIEYLLAMLSLKGGSGYYIWFYPDVVKNVIYTVSDILFGYHVAN